MRHVHAGTESPVRRLHLQKEEDEMVKCGLALMGFAAIALMGCSGKKDAAIENLQNESQEAASNMAQLAAEIPNSDQANEAVNEAADLTNAEQAVENSSHKK